MEKTKKKYGFDKIFVLAMVILSLAGAAVFIFTGIMLPVPLAEVISIGVYYGDFSTLTTGSVISFVIYFVVYLLCIAAMVSIFASKKKRSLWIKLPLSLILISDFAVHAYAFLFASGYGWNYLVSAALDALIIAAVFYENKHVSSDSDGKLESGDEKNEEDASETHKALNNSDGE